MSELYDSSKAISYRQFCKCKLQPYLKNVSINKFKSDLCRLRVSSHRLEIESGRWHKPEAIPFQYRTCQHCNVLEDEYHFFTRMLFI